MSIGDFAKRKRARREPEAAHRNTSTLEYLDLNGPERAPGSGTHSVGTANLADRVLKPAQAQENRARAVWAATVLLGSQAEACRQRHHAVGQHAVWAEAG